MKGKKKFEKISKNFQKGLDKAKRLWYNNQAPQWAGQKIGHWKLNNKRKVQALNMERFMYVWERNSTILREILLKQKVKSNQARIKIWPFRKKGLDTNIREFDPGSGWTLAACITHSSRTEMIGMNLRGNEDHLSGGRVSNAWATCLCMRDNVWKRTLIPHDTYLPHDRYVKDLLYRDGLASD